MDSTESSNLILNSYDKWEKEKLFNTKKEKKKITIREVNFKKERKNLKKIIWLDDESNN